MTLLTVLRFSTILRFSTLGNHCREAALLSNYPYAKHRNNQNLTTVALSTKRVVRQKTWPSDARHILRPLCPALRHQEFTLSPFAPILSFRVCIHSWLKSGNGGFPRGLLNKDFPIRHYQPDLN